MAFGIEKLKKEIYVSLLIFSLITNPVVCKQTYFVFNELESYFIITLNEKPVKCLWF
jgi:hypothetical protein